MNVYHTPALLNESIDGLNIHPDGVYVDVTFGGGDIRGNFEKIRRKGRLYAFDQDADVCRNRIDDRVLCWLEVIFVTKIFFVITTKNVWMAFLPIWGVVASF